MVHTSEIHRAEITSDTTDAARTTSTVHGITKTTAAPGVLPYTGIYSQLELSDQCIISQCKRTLAKQSLKEPFIPCREPSLTPCIRLHLRSRPLQ